MTPAAARLKAHTRPFRLLLFRVKGDTAYLVEHVAVRRAWQSAGVPMFDVWPLPERKPWISLQ